MFLTMNRFKVKLGSEAAFEAVWASRDSHLPQVPGFAGFHLMKGPEMKGAEIKGAESAGPGSEGYRLYASHTLWHSEADFLAWTRSDAFRAAHRGAGETRAIYQGPPELETFTSVQQIDP